MGVFPGCSFIVFQFSFQFAEHPAEQHDHGEVNQGHGRQRHEGGISLAPDDVAALGQVLEGNIAGDAGLLQQYDKFVSQGGKYIFKGLGQDNVNHGLGISQAEAAPGFKLSFVNRHDAARKKFTPVETFTAPSLEAQGQIIGNIAAGNLADGDTIPQDIRLYRELEKGEYLLRVNGHSMEPSIPDGSVVIMKKYTIPPIPKPGTIVQYHDERGVTLKKLVRRKNPETGKMEYTLHPINPAFGDIEPMDGGKISALYVETLDRWEKA